MFIPFNEISNQARVWVYQTSREINASEAEEINEVLNAFCSQWQAHGAPLKTSFDIAFNHFIILAVDENSGGASGCSIDGSVRILKDLGAKLNIDFFDRTQVAFLLNNKVSLFPMTKLKELFAEGTLNASTSTFNNLVATKEEYLRNWKVEVGDSWLARYLPKSTLA
ncbi:MAG: hypothetical protein ABJH04_13195 [Cyclobacteriaceae bacterium]